MKRIFSANIAIFLLLFISLGSFPQTLINTLEDSTFDKMWLGVRTIDSGFAHSGFHYSLTDSTEEYGLGIETALPDELKGKNVVLKSGGWVLADTNNAYAFFVVTLIDNGKQVFWKGIPLNVYFKEKDKWVRFSDSITIPANFTKKGVIKAFLWNASHKQKVGLDDLSFRFEEMKNPSYLPLIDVDKKHTSTNSSRLLFANNYYSVYYDDTNQAVSVKGKNNHSIIENILFLSEPKYQDKYDAGIKNLVFEKAKEKNGKTLLSFSVKTKYSKLKFDIICKQNSSKIDFNSEQKFSKDIDLSRSSIVFEETLPPSEIYRFNRQLQDTDFQDEYWLDKQGLKLGHADSSLIIYHNPDISSIQYDDKNSRIIINLDWEKDHPFFRFPLAPDSSDWKLEQSYSTYKKGNKAINSFSAYAGSKTKNIVRFMKNPSGFEATYIWTEHADYSDIRTNRAAYFGSSKIIEADSAVGGFVKYDIPVTKSVFYDNPDSIRNYNASNHLINSLECAIKTDTAFSRFLDMIHSKGSEICLHTPEQYTTTTQRLEQALAYMQNRYSSPSWIDHGNNNGLQNNREDLVCDGTLPKSEWYALKLWKKYGVEYLHNAYYEENFSFLDMGFNSSIEKAYTGWGDYIPKPDFWQHLSKTGDIYHWPTASALFIDNSNLWPYYFSNEKFEDFISNWSVEINHCYPAWVDPKKGFWEYGTDSVMMAQAGFNKTLALMADLRSKGKLNIPTIQEFMNYRLAIENIDYELLNDGRIRITNNSNHILKGIAFATSAGYILVDRLKPAQKTIGNDLVFWFDIGAGESKVVRLLD
jgi:hypothetical protein